MSTALTSLKEGLKENVHKKWDPSTKHVWYSIGELSLVANFPGLVFGRHPKTGKKFTFLTLSLQISYKVLNSELVVCYSDHGDLFDHPLVRCRIASSGHHFDS